MEQASLDGQSIIMSPEPGSGQVLYAGEVLHVKLTPRGMVLPEHATAHLRTDLNSAPERRRHIIRRVEEGLPRFSAGWRDIPMRRLPSGEFVLSLIACRPGYYEFTAYVRLDGRKLWVGGPNASVSVHPLKWRGPNTIYCAFPRQFGPFMGLENARDACNPPEALALDSAGFTVIPPSGTLSDLAHVLPFLFQELGIRILHLLPMQEVPTHYARMGRFGSPYAAAEMRSINHAYCIFRRNQTPAEQFKEFCARVHAYGGQVLLDFAVNHLGWASELLNDHPEWFVRRADGEFVSPGAWGVTWQDLVELDFSRKEVWRYLADSLLLWCERGVDGFRCDAGYMVPLEAWEYVTAKVHEVFPDTLFLLEGLGGPWEATEAILRMGGMQWAYSELFQQETKEMLLGYLKHMDRVCNEVGILANYAETHDNERLAKRGKEYARMRLALSALVSCAGAFGFANGVEWAATEKIDVHSASGLRWGDPDNLVDWIHRLNQLLSHHPVFRGPARILPLENTPGPVIAFTRERGEERVLAAVNLSPDRPVGDIRVLEQAGATLDHYRCLLTGREITTVHPMTLGPYDVLCFDLLRDRGAGAAEDMEIVIREDEEEIRLRRVLASLWGEEFGLSGFENLIRIVRERGLKALLAAAALGRPRDAEELANHVKSVTRDDIFLGVSEWNSTHGDRTHLLFVDQFLYLEEDVPFRVNVASGNTRSDIHTFQDFGNGRFVAFARLPEGPFTIEQSRLDRPAGAAYGEPHWVPASGHGYVFSHKRKGISLDFSRDQILPSHRFLLTNERGTYTLLPLCPRTVYSKYDALLATNLHPSVPSERVVLLKRCRAWFITPMMSYPLDQEYLVEFKRWPHPTWTYEFRLPGGPVRISEQVQLSTADNLGRLTFSWRHHDHENLELVVRPDIEYRSHHAETKAYTLDEAEYAARFHEIPENGIEGFYFQLDKPAVLVVTADKGRYQAEPEWLYNIPHPHETTRGQEDHGDAFSPGYFRIRLNDRSASVSISYRVKATLKERTRTSFPRTKLPDGNQDMEQVLAHAASQFVAARGEKKTILAGFPWFLDWSRDALIAARGLLAAGQLELVTELIITFAGMERDGTLPNAMQGSDDNDRATSDSPLWLVILIEEMCRKIGWNTLRARARSEGVDIRAVLRSICDNYQKSSGARVRFDPSSALVYSPPHFTWMDTNFPAATPREGYPIEIQALWVRSLEAAARLLDESKYSEIAAKARISIEKLFWHDENRYYVDCLAATAGCPASKARRDTSLRPNQLYLVALRLVDGERARSVVIQTHRHLLVPCALRSVANLPLGEWPWVEGASPPPGFDPMHPYCGRYEGDEDTSRKLAYHNGTAWSQLLPLWIEALLRAFPNDPRSSNLALSLIRSYELELRDGCVGQVSEIFDGDHPHESRGCCAQAWAVTEIIRILKLLEQPSKQ